MKTPEPRSPESVPRDGTIISKRGSGQIVRLPVYRNDVLHALAETGGLPGVDGANAVMGTPYG